MVNKRIYIRLIVFISILLWSAGFSLNVITNGSAISSASTPILNFFYDNVCHQDKEKLISLNGFNFLICARCSGIYFGALLASAFLFFSLSKNEIKNKVFITASVLMLTDVFLNNFIFSAYNKTSAFISGVYFGSVCIITVLKTIEEHFLTKSNH